MGATALSVAVMVLAMAIINGFKYEIREKLFSFWGHIIVTNYSQDASDFNVIEPIRYDAHLVQQMTALPQVAQLTPFIVRPGILKTASAMEGIKLKGISESYTLPETMKFIGKKISFPKGDYARQIIISQTTANRLRVKTGDDLQIYFIEKGNTLPRIRKVTIVGVFHTGMEEVDKSYALCDLRMLQQINGWQADEIDGYQLNLTNEKWMDATSVTISEKFLEAPLQSFTMKEVYVNIFDWLQLQNMNAQIVLIIMAIVAIINLAVATVIIIVEQSRLIGVLKALGMSFRKIMLVFLYHSLWIAFLGIVLGNLLAFSFCRIQKTTGFLKLDETTYYMSQVPVRLEILPILAINVVTFFCCIIFMWLPALYIRRIQPVRVLQFK